MLEHNPKMRRWNLKTLLIVNPMAGKARIESCLPDIAGTLTQSGMDVTVKLTQKKDDAKNIAAVIAGQFDLVVCAGGDGTLNEVVTGLMTLDKRPKLGYIPAGTTNDFAATLKIPKNVKKAVKLIISGKTRLLDIGAFQKGNFVYVASFGFMTEVSYATNQKDKNKLGKFAYFFEGAKRLGDNVSYKLKIEYDGLRMEGDFAFGAITNTYSMAGLIKFKPEEVNLDDGMFEVLLIQKPPHVSILRRIFINKLMNRKIDKNLVETFRASDIKITSAEPVPWCIDGESGGSHNEVIIKNRSRSLEMITP